MSGAEGRAALMEQVKSAPMAPGCYLYRDAMGNVIYVGKAKRLRNRVRQYFQARREDGDPKLEQLVRVIADVEYRVTDTERDALMLEYRLIKRYRPWFNAQMKADPRPLLLRIDRDAAVPTISVSASAADDGAAYFGYFRDSYDAQDALALLGAVWRTPACGKASFAKPGRPCVQHQVGRCMGPCGGDVDQAAYRQAVDEAARMLAGERVGAFDRLEADMRRQAAARDYEQAAAIKRRMESLDRLRLRSRRLGRFPEGADVAVFLRAYREAGCSLFLVRDRAVVLRADFEGGLDGAVLARFCEAARCAEAPQPDSDWLPGCLTEVLADKLFVPLPEGVDVRAALEAAYGRWAGTPEPSQMRCDGPGARVPPAKPS